MNWYCYWIIAALMWIEMGNKLGDILQLSILDDIYWFKTLFKSWRIKSNKKFIDAKWSNTSFAKLKLKNKKSV